MSLTQKPKYSERYPPKYKINEVYTFTVNPNDNFQYKCAPKKSLGDYDRLEEFIKFAKSLITDLSINGIDIHVNVDISAPYNAEGKKTCSRLHLHGMIYFQNIEAIRWFHLYGSTRIFDIGIVEIDTIKDFDIWYDYCTKTEWLGFPQFGHILGYNYFRKRFSKESSDTVDDVPVSSVNPDNSTIKITLPSGKKLKRVRKRKRQPKGRSEHKNKSLEIIGRALAHNDNLDDIIFIESEDTFNNNK